MCLLRSLFLVGGFSFLIMGCVTSSNTPLTPKTPQMKIVTAAMKNDFKAVDKILASGVDINGKATKKYSFTIWYYLLDGGRGGYGISADAIEKLVDRHNLFPAQLNEERKQRYL